MCRDIGRFKPDPLLQLRSHKRTSPGGSNRTKRMPVSPRPPITRKICRADTQGDPGPNDPIPPSIPVSRRYQRVEGCGSLRQAPASNALQRDGLSGPSLQSNPIRKRRPSTPQRSTDRRSRRCLPKTGADTQPILASMCRKNPRWDRKTGRRRSLSIPCRPVLGVMS